mmetsp:Transcript_39530/g.97219  ORF Transcript_39530/g.97219 Transcript_39530/m.97219 type:complete len:475 (+) Transcript_39530:189-1613(+)|eukprot:CAMPEP_0206214282 /NCGR_PEP_ID=MMETSP0047_2-20121206/1582_1 /ASSEMBLY_ACC=CAM_ASM_000192 /TAXON_ID=195065 /ORGANISM="Chroomonas mesostigmatica_cf, Strain CCMP1168" /LENGTH=474 /DNA_ID=CAMNT_0053636507 /DNA_START=173 /DNA_END=1597 /DNA_ORIENTATION=+
MRAAILLLCSLSLTSAFLAPAPTLLPVGRRANVASSFGRSPLPKTPLARSASRVGPVTMGLKRCVDNLTREELEGKRVLLRCDLNVPITNGVISDDTRIKESLPTIIYLLENGAKVAVASHLGRPEGGFDPSYSLAPVAKRLGELLGCPVPLAKDCVGEAVAEAVEQLHPEGGICMLENLRFQPGCEQNDKEFAKQLAKPFDMFVNDAFGSAHRAHSSTVGVTRFLSPCVAGLLLSKELNFLDGPVKEPKRPFAAIVGGSQVSEKIDMIDSLLERVDKMIIGGTMSYTFLAAQGVDVGGTYVDTEKIPAVKKLLEKAKKRKIDIVLPTDAVLAPTYKASTKRKTQSIENWPEYWIALDIGPATIKSIEREIAGCQTVLWSGPMGVYEFDKFRFGTDAVAGLLAEATKAGVITVVSGGDTLNAIKKAGYANQMAHISTAGAATLELLEGNSLPGVDALDDSGRRGLRKRLLSLIK